MRSKTSTLHAKIYILSFLCFWECKLQGFIFINKIKEIVETSANFVDLNFYENLRCFQASVRSRFSGYVKKEADDTQKRVMKIHPRNPFQWTASYICHQLIPLERKLTGSKRVFPGVTNYLRTTKVIHEKK